MSASAKNSERRGDFQRKGDNMRLVILESPYAGCSNEEVEKNIEYARACLRDALKRGEAPIASHLLYTQPGVLRDELPHERTHGVDAGLAWRRVADASVVYTDRGISRGMEYGIKAAEDAGVLVEYRSIFHESKAQEDAATERRKRENNWHRPR